MSAARPVAPPDLRSPLVLDTRELGRRPGSMRRVQREVAAPEGWALDLARVPVGSPAALDLRLESVVEGVLVSGAVTVAVDAECGRCLEPVHISVTAPVQELFAYDPEYADDDALQVVGDLVDLREVLRDAVVLALPLNPHCDDDCAGLCSTCGERLADGAEHHHEQTDPRWAALAALHPQDREEN